MSLKMAHKVILPPKKIISRSFLNSGTLIVKIWIKLQIPGQQKDYDCLTGTRAWRDQS